MKVRARRRLSTVAFVLALALSSTNAQAQTVSIDFETLPDGSIPYGSVADSYSAWGITFFQEGIGPQCPGFVKGVYGSEDFFAFCYVTTYPPGFNIILEFSSPVNFVAADVMSAPGRFVTLKAFSYDGQQLATAQSSDSQDFWKGGIEVTSDEGISRAEFWPSHTNSGVGIDDLEYGWTPIVGIPTLGTWGLLFFSVLLCTAAAVLLRCS